MNIHSKQLQEKFEKIWPAPCPFKPESKKTKNGSHGDGEDEEEETSKTRSFEISFDPNDEKSETYMRKVQVFEDGTPEDWVKHKIEVQDLIQALGYKTSEQQMNVWRSLFEGKAKDLFRAFYHTRHEANEKQGDNKVSQETVIKQSLNDMAKKFFGNDWFTAARRQKGYMRKNLCLGDKNPESFYDRVKQLNSYLPPLPYKGRPTTL